METSQYNQLDFYAIAARLTHHSLTQTNAPMKLKTTLLFLVLGLVQKLAWAAIGITKGQYGMLCGEDTMPALC